MRPLRPGTGRSVRRGLYRLRYARHIQSARWQQRRREWLATEVARLGRDPACVVCGTPWTLHDDLHHVTYERLGRELHGDLLPICRTCHEELHAILERSPSWLALRRSLATRGIVDRLSTLRAAGGGLPTSEDPRLKPT